MIGQIQVASQNGTYAIRLIGDVRMVLCLSFDKYIGTMFGDIHFSSVIFDLTAADAVDSTTLGLMAKIALQCQRRELAKPVLLVEAQGMRRLFETMGFDEIFLMTDSTSMPSLQAFSLSCEEGSEDAFKTQVIEAHKVLMSLNQNNHNAFKSLVDILENQ